MTSLSGRTIAEIALLAVLKVEYPSPFSEDSPKSQAQLLQVDHMDCSPFHDKIQATS